jgi:HD-GYP domain-containing protein (c-di-GMP phosphodiesterase class II)
VRLRTRAFFICFVPFALLLTSSFWMIQRFVQSTVRERVESSLRESQEAIGRLHSKSDLQNSRFLKVAGDNAALKAGLQILLAHPHSSSAQLTVEDQLREMGGHMGFDFLGLAAPDGSPLAAVVRRHDAAAGQLDAVPAGATFGQSNNGLTLIDGTPYQMASVPIDENQENLGSLVVGERFDFSEFSSPAVLLHGSSVIATNIAGASMLELTGALKNCGARSECDIRFRGDDWITLRVSRASAADAYVLRTLGDLDAATNPVTGKLRRIFMSVAGCSVLMALFCSIASSQTTVRPIAAIVSHLRNAARTGALPEFDHQISNIAEIRELMESYNRAAFSVRKANETLHDAYMEFTSSLASALDARDRYTAGHSWRVSQLSCLIAAAMNLPHDDIERIRVGALLHDIGKIGVPDEVLQKPGRLTQEEFAMVKEHPVIGRRILEGVQGFASYLPAVELHHENWDGSGYPHGLAGEKTPLDARIIHVADAYDAMTSDRSYRQGMPAAKALSILAECSGTQFDSHIVGLFCALPQDLITENTTQADSHISENAEVSRQS